MKESITRKKRAASVANVGSQCDLSLKIPGETSRNSYLILHLCLGVNGEVTAFSRLGSLMQLTLGDPHVCMSTSVRPQRSA